MENRCQTEGDTNLSELRLKWQKESLSSKTVGLIERDSKVFFSQSLSTPCLNAIQGANGIYLYDLDGKKYMDFHGNSAHQVGYHNPYVINALHAQLEALPFAPRRYTCEAPVRLAERLIELWGGNPAKVLFAPGGAEAVEMALKLARKYTGRYKTVSMWDSFHEATLGTISVGGERDFRRGIGPLMPGDIHIPPYDSFRCLFGGCGDCNLKCLDYLQYVLERESDIAALIMEPIRATDVQIPPAAYFRRIRDLCDRYGVLLIFDEIPTALGRTGTFFVHEHFGVKPDVVILGKGLGGAAVPIAALLADKRFDCAGDVSLGHFTHEKNPLGAAAGLAVIECIQKEHLLEHTAALGHLMARRLNEMQKRYRIVGDSRCIGLLGCLELVQDRKTKKKAVRQAERVLYDCLGNGLSFKVSNGNCIILSPPLIITEEELCRALDILEQAVAEQEKLSRCSG